MPMKNFGSWECEDCEQVHPPEARYCPVCGRARFAVVTELETNFTGTAPKIEWDFWIVAVVTFGGAAAAVNWAWWGWSYNLVWKLVT